MNYCRCKYKIGIALEQTWRNNGGGREMYPIKLNVNLFLLICVKGAKKCR